MPQVSLSAKVQLLNAAGSAKAVFDALSDIRQLVPDASERLVSVLRDFNPPRVWAEQELHYCHENKITVLPYGSDDYPQRLLECTDAPTTLFYRGSANLNSPRVINIIGTRHSTAYGADCVRKLISQLHEIDKSIIIVSGLAYGIDISAHRNALVYGMPTVGVLAHGLDDIYPSSHRDTAAQMLLQGGLITEYPSRTRLDKRNFVSRNRIVAGISDATILVESASRGGGLITAGIARSYVRDVFAFPGRVGDPYSEGCNNLIRDNGAAVITSAEDLLKAMNWNTDEERNQKRQAGIERQLFVNLSAEEQLVVEALTKQNDLQINNLTVVTGLHIGKLTSLLFEMELKGIIRPLAGGVYHLLQ